MGDLRRAARPAPIGSRQLDGHHRVTGGGGVDAVEPRAREGGSEVAPHGRGGAVRVERSEGKALHAGDGEHLLGGDLAGHRSRGGQDRHVERREPTGEEGHGPHRVSVEPVEVVDGDDDGAPGSHGGDGGSEGRPHGTGLEVAAVGLASEGDGVERPALRRVERLHHPVRDGSEQIAQPRPRRGGLCLGRAGGHHARTSSGGGGDGLGPQPRLPDARFALEDGDRRAHVDGLEDRAQSRHLALATGHAGRRRSNRPPRHQGRAYRDRGGPLIA